MTSCSVLKVIVRQEVIQRIQKSVQNKATAFSFACRRVNYWNSLPNHVICAVSLRCFKRVYMMAVILHPSQCRPDLFIFRRLYKVDE